MSSEATEADTGQDGYMNHPPANLAYGFCNGAEYPVGGRVKRVSAPRAETKDTQARGG